MKLWNISSTPPPSKTRFMTEKHGILITACPAVNVTAQVEPNFNGRLR